jgi:hypothetical protein
MNQISLPEVSNALLDPSIFNRSTFVLLLLSAVFESLILKQYIMWIMG